MKGRVILYTAALILLAALTGCENGYDCYLENVAYNRIGFYKSDSTDVKYELPEVLTVSLMINGIDSIAVNHIENADKLMLPMSYTNECDTIIFNYDNGIADTLFVDHENIMYYQSMECGTIMYHRIEDIRYTRSLIDSVEVVMDIVKFDANENVKIYFVE